MSACRTLVEIPHAGHLAGAIDKPAANRQMPRMKYSAQLPLACIRTVLVLLFLVAGGLGEAIRQPYTPVVPKVEQLHSATLQLASVTAKERSQIQRPDQAASANGNAADDAHLTQTAAQFPPVERLLLLTEARAPPLFARTLRRANRARAPPVDMI